MKCEILINNESIGIVDFQVIDLTMGAISGILISNENYHKYQSLIRKQTSETGISNLSNFSYKIITDNKIEILAQGGIGIIDSKKFNELTVECAGVDLSLFEI